ncbi:MAG: hypothetical protein PHV59_02180 [Victivallales bacterium]|nr:hypothetical protein [Victivallales bacterium]
MKASAQIVYGKMLWVSLFVLFVAVFSLFRPFIGKCAVGLLALTGEISLAKTSGKSDIPVAPIQIVTKKKLISSKPVSPRTAAGTSVKVSEMFKHPVTANYPKTRPPVISCREGFPDWDDAGLKLFTPLRKYDGTVWNKERTEIKCSTDGRRLYLLCRFYDRHPEQAVTSHDGAHAWQDDSIEVFLMKNRKSKFYCQYILSVTGKGTVLGYSNKPQSWQWVRYALPKDFVSPHYDADRFDWGFELELSIALNNIGIEDLKPGDSLLMQIVRDYRGQGSKKSVLLQLFPVYIYGDVRMGGNNHDRRAFQPVKVQRGK